MEGFGSADVTTPFNYGSVADGIRHNPSLEQKLKKKYWKTKQTVIQKLHKSQDEFVVAGDADIDTKLEVAYHLRSSCHQLLQVLEKYCFRLRDLSAHELAFGEYLGAYSEKEYTNAGEVMQSSGKVLELEAKARLTVLPGLQRLYQEMATFEASALSDLNISIQTLEKARTDYRAALLWMKDVSGKLQNPDYRDQLVRFRESQAAVKEAKARFDKLKIDLTEKIGMVNASRCNLLSRSLPTYQKSVLSFSDSAASEFYRVLVNLRSHHHHQYKVHRDMEEIRDLESEEFLESPLLSGRSFSPLQSRRKSDDDPLIDVSSACKESASSDGVTSGDGEAEAGKEATEGGHRQVPPQTRWPAEHAWQTAKPTDVINDMPLTGVEADLRALQSELIQEFGGGALPTMLPQPQAGSKEDGKSRSLGPASLDLNDLLGMGLGLEGEGEGESPDFGPMVSSEGVASKQDEEGGSSDVLTDQWNNFSSLMMSTRAPTETSLSDWEKEFMAEPTPSAAAESSKEDPFLALDPLASKKQSEKFASIPLALLGSAAAGATAQEPSGLADDLLSLDVSAGSTLNPIPASSSQQALVPTQTPPLLPLSLGPSLHPTLSSGIRQNVGGAMPTKPHPPTQPALSSRASKETDKKGTAWMNVFAHLDPLSNEKA